MAELMVDFITSLEGCAAAENWPGFWGLEGPEYLGSLAQDPHKDDTVLMGRKTYELMHGFASSGEEGVLDELTRVPKVVFSSTLAQPLAWANTRLVSGDPVEAVRALKEAEERPMRTLGSLTLCRALLQAGLVDRFRVGVFPVITGASGRECIYEGYPDVRLELVQSRVFDGRIQLLEYVPTVLDGPPGTTGQG